MVVLDKIEVMVIAGTEAYNLDFAEFGKITGSTLVKTPFGESAKVTLIDVNGIAAGVMSRHGETGYSISAPFVNYRANIWAAKELGAKRIISWNGAGAINRLLSVGDFVVLDDLIDVTRKREYTFYRNRGYGFIRQNPVFCPEVRAALYQAAAQFSPHVFKRGIYVCTEGPRLETAAEIRVFATWGADVVGMTPVPEVYLAKELEMCYASITYVSNYAEGLVEPQQAGQQGVFGSLLPSDEAATLKKSVQLLPRIVSTAISLLPEERSCPCATAMKKYRDRGDIGDDWHTWVNSTDR